MLLPLLITLYLFRELLYITNTVTVFFLLFCVLQIFRTTYTCKFWICLKFTGICCALLLQFTYTKKKL